jgi:hypothetical protein
MQETESGMVRRPVNLQALLMRPLGIGSRGRFLGEMFLNGEALWELGCRPQLLCSSGPDPREIAGQFYSPLLNV